MNDILRLCDPTTGHYVILVVGSYVKALELYAQFPNALIYIFQCPADSIAACKVATAPYLSRILLVEGESFTPEATIDICYIHGDFLASVRKLPTNRIKLFANYAGIVYNNKSNVEMFCVYHTKFYLREDNFYFTFFGVNELYPKQRQINGHLEYELDIYNPFLQKRGYMETSAYLHVYWNKLYKTKDMIGFSQYDMNHKAKYDTLEKDTMYLLLTGLPIVKDGVWDRLMFPHLRNLEFLMSSYNKFFGKQYTLAHLESIPLSLWQTGIYPVRIYEKLCGWLERLVEEVYPWSVSPPYETHFGSMGGYTERALSLFNAFEIVEGTPASALAIEHGEGAVYKTNYSTSKSPFNQFSQDVHAKYIENVTGDERGVDFCMFHARTVFRDQTYSCERICKGGRNGLRFVKDGVVREYGFEIEGEDPRLCAVGDHVYVIFICLSPYAGQTRGIGITKFDEWDPVFLQVDGMRKNGIEKNWAPFEKDGCLYFVYNYDPLVVLSYDFNRAGVCRVVFKQGDVALPFDTSGTHLRGGSNLIRYKDGYYIGGCHSRIFKSCFEHYTHIVLLNTTTWTLEYVSKPVLYYFSGKEPLNNWHTHARKSVKPLEGVENRLTDRSPHIIQDPISLYQHNDRYYVTVNVRDCVSLLYELSFRNLFDACKTGQPIGQHDRIVRDMIAPL